MTDGTTSFAREIAFVLVLGAGIYATVALLFCC